MFSSVRTFWYRDGIAEAKGLTSLASWHKNYRSVLSSWRIYIRLMQVNNLPAARQPGRHTLPCAMNCHAACSPAHYTPQRSTSTNTHLHLLGHILTPSLPTQHKPWRKSGYFQTQWLLHSWGTSTLCIKEPRLWAHWWSMLSFHSPFFLIFWRWTQWRPHTL